MTSYRQPDYDIDLRLSHSDFHAVAGIAFHATITFGENPKRLSGMLIVPEENSFSKVAPIATAWLWSEDHSDAPAETSVTVTLVESCDPMLTQDEQQGLITQKGLTLEGVVTRNWNS
ncbi:hypothetical protein ACFL3I_14230 [Pseudomonadota bacterium]